MNDIAIVWLCIARRIIAIRYICKVMDTLICFLICFIIKSFLTYSSSPTPAFTNYKYVLSCYMLYPHQSPPNSAVSTETRVFVFDAQTVPTVAVCNFEAAVLPINSSSPGLNGRHFADDISKRNSLNEKLDLWLKFNWCLFLSVQLMII